MHRALGTTPSTEKGFSCPCGGQAQPCVFLGNHWRLLDSLPLDLDSLMRLGWVTGESEGFAFLCFSGLGLQAHIA